MATGDEGGVESLLMEAWTGQLDLTVLIDRCGRLEQARKAPVAAVLYEAWLKRTKSPLAHVAYFNLGATLSGLGDLSGAEEAYRNAIALAPGFVQPRLNLGLLFERAGQPDKAVQEWQWVLDNVSADTPEKKALLILALNHLGRVLEASRRYQEALAHLTRSLALDPAQDDVIHHWVFLRQKQCCWPIYEPFANVTADRMRQATSALAMIAVTDDPETQLAAARRFADRRVLKGLSPLAAPRGYGHRKIRIGYCSGDFCLHPVSMLMVELFELHDRDRFEIHGYDWSPEDGSAMRRRVMSALGNFHRIHAMTDEAAARLIREHEIDVLVDLQGQTAGARMSLLSYRPAPIQVTYLGLPATTGLPSIDYVIADRYLIPESEAPHYSERPLYMPDVYQVSDRRRSVAETPARSACGLPDDAFVFCSFNNNFKYTPEMFGAWMRILLRVPGSVLWLLSDNPWAETNLRREAAARGVDDSRLVFAPRVSPEKYLARYATADLFLDSFPFNAGTTANDALFMGLPVLTRSGRTFASRMAGALLTAVGLPELIAGDLADYEDKAVALASRADECRRLKAHLIESRESGVLFDTARFTRHLEDRFAALVAAL